MEELPDRRGAFACPGSRTVASARPTVVTLKSLLDPMLFWPHRWLAIGVEIVRIALMKELRRSNDLIYVSWVRATLEADGIDCIVLDEHISGIEGGINAFPRRIMVDDDVFDEARTLLQAAEAKLNGD
jgi:hypothetical protein